MSDCSYVPFVQTGVEPTDCPSSGTLNVFIPIANQVIAFKFNPLVDSLRNTITSLDYVTTTNLSTSTLLVVILNGIFSVWQLINGTADATDPTGQVAPLDYNPTTNNRFWSKVE